MKKLPLIIILLILTSVFLTSCINLPENPQDVLPFCKDLYEELLISDPDFPHAFIGYCVATIQTGETRAFQGLCRYEGVWDDISVSSRQECIEYFKALD